MDFGRVITAMVTPFDEHGKIDFNQTSVLIEHLLANGTDGLVVAGTTGESPTLSHEEKVLLFKHVIAVVNKRVPVLAGTGNYDTAASISLTKDAELSGVDGIMLVTPYYNKPNQRGLYAHFSAIAEATTLPIMLYNIPGRSVINMTAETTIKLSKIKNIVSIKEASGDLNQVAEIIENTPDDFTVYSGDDGTALPILAIGGYGVVSVASHIIGNDISEIINAFNSGNLKEAASVHRKALPIINSLFSAPSPSPVKAALNIKGIDVGNVRLPLVDLTIEEKERLERIIK